MQLQIGTVTSSMLDKCNASANNLLTKFDWRTSLVIEYKMTNNRASIDIYI